MNRQEQAEVVVSAYVRETARCLIGTDLEKNKEAIYRIIDDPATDVRFAQFIQRAYGAALGAFDHGEAETFGAGEQQGDGAA